MDFEQTQVRFPTLSEFNDKLKLSVDATVRKLAMRLMDSIAKGEDMSLEYLLTKYGNVLDNITVEPVAKKQRKTIPSNIRCLAKINGNGRCSRKRKDVSYCGGHNERRPHGEFSEEEAELLEKSDLDDSISSIDSNTESNRSNSSNESNTSKKCVVIIKKKVKSTSVLPEDKYSLLNEGDDNRKQEAIIDEGIKDLIDNIDAGKNIQLCCREFKVKLIQSEKLYNGGVGDTTTDEQIVLVAKNQATKRHIIIDSEELYGYIHC